MIIAHEKKSQTHSNLMNLDDARWKLLAFNIRSHEYFKRMVHISQLGTLPTVMAIKSPLERKLNQGSNRYQHCMGASFMARRLGNRLQKTQNTSVRAYHTFVLEAATALHDVGHGPFSHEFDNFLERQVPALLSHEQRSIRLTLFILRDCHAQSRTWRSLLPEGVDMLHEQISFLILGKPHEDLPNVLQFLVNAKDTSTCDLDRLDYLHRDVHALMPSYVFRRVHALCLQAVDNAHISLDGQTFFFERLATETLMGLRLVMFHCFYKMTTFNAAWMDRCFLRFMGPLGGLKWECLQLESVEDADNFCRLFQEQNIAVL
jgi:hypothetical protein